MELRPGHPRSHRYVSTIPDHVAVVIQNYRWRLGLAQGEAKYNVLEKERTDFPVITVPTIGHTLPQEAPHAFAGAIMNVAQS